jgi:glycosyltransferase involved in cell wall biosynthesis
MLMYYKVRDKVFASIFDDSYNTMHPANPAYKFWNHGFVMFKDGEGNTHETAMCPLPLLQLAWGLSMTKGLQTVSQTLANDWDFCTNTHVINNHLVIEEYENITPLLPHEGIVIGWTGSLSHYDSFDSSGVIAALECIVNKFPEVDILISGDKKVFDMIKIPENRKLFSPYVMKEQYPSLIRTLDIGLAPLYGEYDKRRSWIKGLEYLALGVPFIASDLPTYSSLSDYCTLVNNSPEDWETAITDHIISLKKYKERALDMGVPFAKTQDIKLHLQERIDLYNHFIQTPYKPVRL